VQNSIFVLYLAALPFNFGGMRNQLSNGIAAPQGIKLLGDPILQAG
jgi:hypothetical protein